MKTILAYLAGAIDANGYITIQRVVKNIPANKAPSMYYNPKVGLSETNRIIPVLLKRTFGGSIYGYTPKNPSHRPWFVWMAGEQLAARALRKLLPFLRLKKSQAILVIKLAEITKHQWREIKRTQKPPYRITPSMQRQRERLWLRVTKLNQPRNRRVHFAATS